MLNIAMRTCSITDVAFGNLIMYDTGTKFGIRLKLPTQSANIGIYSLSESKPILCLDDFQEVIPGFQTVIDLGNDFWFAVSSAPRMVSHISELDPGVLVVKGEKFYFAHTVANHGPKACRGVNIEDGKSTHGDTIGYSIGVCDHWVLKVPAIRERGESIALFRFPN